MPADRPAPLPTDSNAPVVLVTGAAKRLGREIALQLAQAGWRVAVHYRDSVEDATKTVATCARLTGGAAAFRCNLGNETAVRNLLPTVAEHMGRVDAVVHGASTVEHDLADTFSFAAMDKHLRSNAGAAIFLAQSLHSHLSQRQAHGAAVHMLDQKLWNPSPDYLSYTLSKAALEAANTMLALSLAPVVRVVGVAVNANLDPAGNAAEAAAAVLFALKHPTLTGTSLLAGTDTLPNPGNYKGKAVWSTSAQGTAA